ncbi:class I SAM-dependent methyltransferase [Nocardiopsis sp. NPDC058631]|uniref:class I SAM-dependent methyltransferase n=1 Tax=Nocardiopsis sp. NPDC058631 TaxID=3346566 RepID=UPI003657F7C6
MSRSLPGSLLDVSWDHNSHYHGHLLRQALPYGPAVDRRALAGPPRGGPADARPPRPRALDVGCGGGRFARLLATRGFIVDAIDPENRMIETARALTPPRLPVDYRVASLEEAELDPEGYGFVSAVSSIHHMPFGPSLERMASALAPGGTLAVLGHYRERGWADAAVALAALGPQWTIGAGLRVARALTKTPDLHRSGPTADMPVREPDMGLDEIAEAVRAHLPGARLRRLLFWRYSLVYTRPARSRTGADRRRAGTPLP